MREVIRALIEAVQSGKAVSFCRLVETRGSTPQKAGAAMLVFPDGSQVGTLGGGCVEAEVKRQALRNLTDGKAEVATFKLDDDYGWDDGLICGGRMRVLIEPLRDAQSAAYFQRLDELLSGGRGFTEAIAFDSEKCGLATPVAYLFDAAGEPIEVMHADAGPEAAPDLVRHGVEPLDGRPRAKAERGVAFLPALPRCRLLIVGGGHIGRAVADLAPDLDFEVTVVDDREDVISQERFPKAEKRIAGPIGKTLGEISIDSDTYCLIVTRGHNHDEEALYHLAESPARYVGMIGSKRKIKLIFDDLLNEGISAESLSRVYAPLGIDIGSQTVPEIAVSILAELVSHRNRGGVVPGRPSPVIVAEAM